MLESMNYSFRNPKNIIWVIYRINIWEITKKKKKKNHGVLRGPQLGKQRWRARLGISRVNSSPGRRLIDYKATPFTITQSSRREYCRGHRRALLRRRGRLHWSFKCQPSGPITEQRNRNRVLHHVTHELQKLLQPPITRRNFVGRPVFYHSLKCTTGKLHSLTFRLLGIEPIKQLPSISTV